MPPASKLLVYLRPYWRPAAAAPAFLVFEVAMDLLQPRLVQHIIDAGVARGDMAVALRTGAWMVGCAAIGLVAGAGCSVFSMLAAQRFGASLRSALFRKIEGLAFPDLDALGTGPLITRLTNDVSQVQEAVALLLRGMIRMPLLLAGSVVMAILTCPRLAWIMLLLVPLVAWTLRSILRRMHPLFRTVQRQLDALNVVLQENLAGIRVVKAFARAAHEAARFGRANDTLMEGNVVAVRLSALTMPTMMLMLNAGIVAALWAGGRAVAAGDLRVGQVIAFINYLMQSLMALRLISMMIVQFSRAQASAQRVGELLDVQPAVADPPRPVVLRRPRGGIAFQGVRFGYGPPEGKAALDGIDLAVEPGETVVVLGATGSGKSSLVHLIPRFYDPWRGTVAFDGADVRTLRREDLRRQVGIALQESVLFSGTIRENIRYGRPDASESEVVAAAEAAQADGFIRGLPDGYDTLANQRGVNLSGGQKQRIAIARALLPRPPILILDDSTSAVDLRTEERIYRAVFGQGFPQTRLLVAQRIGAAEKADRVVFLEEGRIAAVGTHSRLFAAHAAYRNLFHAQARPGVLSHGGE